jgi:hypothetical protein
MNTVTRCHTNSVTFRNVSAFNVNYTGTNTASRVTNCEADDDTVSIDAATLQEGNSWQETRKRIVFMDDFLGDSLSPEWDSAVGSDPQVVAPAIPITRNGGYVSMTAGDDAAGTMAVNGVQLQGENNWVAGSSGLEIEIRLRISAITDICVFAGFTDQTAALEMPFTLGASDALTSNASDAVGVLFDTAADTDRWWLVGVKANVDATAQDAGVAPTALTMETWRIVLSSAGAATFFRNGSQIGTQMSNAVSTAAGNLLAPVVAVFSRGAATRTVDVDYIQIKQNRV